jgi:hypothetical protein
LEFRISPYTGSAMASDRVKDSIVFQKEIKGIRSAWEIIANQQASNAMVLEKFLES